MTQRLLTLDEAADWLGCSVQTLRRRLERGELPAFRDGRLVRLRQGDLAAYVAKRTRQPAQPKGALLRAPRRAQALPSKSLFDLPDPLR